MQYEYIYKIVDTARDDEVVGYIHTERDLLDFLRDVPEETREKMDLIPAAVENEGKSEAEAPRKNANDWYWEHKNDRSLAQPRKEKVYPKYINGMTEEDIQKKIKEEKKRAGERDTIAMFMCFFSIVIHLFIMFRVWMPSMDEFAETSNLPVLINILILLVGTVLFIAGLVFFTFFFPMILTEKIMGGPILSGKELENYVRQKYAYKVPTTEGPTEQKQAKLQTGTSASNNKEEK